MAKNYECEVVFVGGTPSSPKEIYTKIKTPIYECGRYWFFVAKDEKQKTNLYDFSSGHCVFRNVKKFSKEELATLVFFIAHVPAYRRVSPILIERNNANYFTIINKEAGLYHPGVNRLWLING